jgi:hypothetical protein
LSGALGAFGKAAFNEFDRENELAESPVVTPATQVLHFALDHPKKSRAQRDDSDDDAHQHVLLEPVLHNREGSTQRKRARKMEE